MLYYLQYLNIVLYFTRNFWVHILTSNYFKMAQNVIGNGDCWYILLSNFCLQSSFDLEHQCCSTECCSLHIISLLLYLLLLWYIIILRIFLGDSAVNWRKQMYIVEEWKFFVIRMIFHNGAFLNTSVSKYTHTLLTIICQPNFTYCVHFACHLFLLDFVADPVLNWNTMYTLVPISLRVLILSLWQKTPVIKDPRLQGCRNYGPRF